MKKILGILLLMVCLSASVFAFGVDSTMKVVMDSWMGCHIDQVIDRWGYPTEEKTIAGHKLYYWTETRVVENSVDSHTTVTKDKKGHKHYDTYTTGGDTTVYTATRIIEVDDKGIVIKGQYSGNDLPFTFMGKAKDWLNPTYQFQK